MAHGELVVEVGRCLAERAGDALVQRERRLQHARADLGRFLAKAALQVALLFCFWVRVFFLSVRVLGVCVRR